MNEINEQTSVPKECTARTKMLLGENAMERLFNAHVCIVGVGGVGGHCAMSLARTGVGKLTIIDADTVDVTNLNRQAAASLDTLGLDKVEAMKRKINAVSNCQVNTIREFILPENAEEILPQSASVIVDACDTVAAKLAIAKFAHEHKIPLISCMGVGKRLDPTKVYITDIFSTQGCPIARVMRNKLRKLGITKLAVVTSTEPPRKLRDMSDDESTRTPSSAAFVPAAAGLALGYWTVSRVIE